MKRAKLMPKHRPKMARPKWAIVGSARLRSPFMRETVRATALCADAVNALRARAARTVKMFRVQRRMCATCIYHKGSPLDIRKLERDVADKHMAGYFCGHRICHHSKALCCRGFWDRHKDAFTAGQIAQRLGVVEFVDEDTLAK